MKICNILLLQERATLINKQETTTLVTTRSLVATDCYHAYSSDADGGLFQP